MENGREEASQERDIGVVSRVRVWSAHRKGELQKVNSGCPVDVMNAAFELPTRHSFLR